MAKRKRKKGRTAQSAAALRRNGLQAFNRKDYGAAIDVWERAYKQRAEPQTATALAEALFRRGVQRPDGQSAHTDAAVADLQRAVELKPNDSCYVYHLGLALHRLGRSAEALPLYKQVRQRENAFAKRAAYPLALALLQQGDNPADHPVWSELSESERAMLCFGASSDQIDAPPDDWPVFWRGVAALRNGRYPEARHLLQQALEAPDSAHQEALSHYFLGLIAAHGENWDGAGRHWQSADAAGLNQPHLQSNLGELYHRLAEERLVADDPAGAIAAAQEAARLLRESPPSLTELEAQAWQQLGYRAATANKWESALAHWQKARQLDGGSFRLAYNLALALEKQEEFEAAGEAWREALRRRPRRSDHPDAIDDEQVARLWQRSAEAYQKAGAFDDAIQVYRHAVKWNENNLAVRLDLAQSLMLNGQLRAAENELERILELDPKNIPALIQMGEVLAGQESWYQAIRATQVWKQVLQLDPQNQRARHLLADFYVNSAEAALSWGEVGRAIENYQQALQYLPNDPAIMAALGSCFLFTDDAESAEGYINQAIERDPTNLRVYDPILRAWLELEEPEEAERVLAQMETAVASIPYQFYMGLALHCLMYGLADLAQPWLERAVASAPPSENILVRIGEALMLTGNIDLAQEYLEKAIAAGQEPANAYLALGMVATRQGKRDLAEKHWQAAEKLARKEKDLDLLDVIEETRMVFGGPLGALFSMMGDNAPNLLELSQILSAGFDEDWDDEDWDEEDWDDDGFFDF